MGWYHRLRNTTRSERLSSELDRELEFHLAERVDELVAGGMSEAEARREARLRFGNPVQQKERTRERDVLPWLESLAGDLRYATRSLRANPGFALVAILSLGLGIGANTAIFSLIDAVLLRPLPVSEPEELVQLTMEGGDTEFTNPLWEAIRDRQDVFSGVFAFAGKSFDLANGGEARPVAGSWVSGDFFNTLGVPAGAGRMLTPEDDYRGCPAVAVLGHDLWRASYGSDPAVVGRSVSLDGHPFEIVGVAAAGFFGAEVGRSAQVYAPLCSKALVEPNGGGLDERSYWYLYLMGRPRADLSAAELHARLAAISPAVFRETLPSDWDAEGQRNYLRNSLATDPAANGFSGIRFQYRPALLAMMGVVGLVLLIACANVANLLLARAATRQREVAIRLAIGAGRGRLIRQLLTESLLLALLGAAVGLLFATWASRLLVRFFSGRGEAVWLDLSVDGRILAFTLLVATGTAILFGLAPAWRATRVNPQAAMKANERGIAEGHSRLTVGKALVVGQIALSLVLVLVAGLLLGTFRELATLDPGFEPEGVLLVSVDLRKGGYAEEQLPAVKAEILARMRALPGVRSASASAITPVSGAGWNSGVSVEGYTPAGPKDAMIFLNAVSDDFFATLGTPLLAGRDIGEGDVAGGPAVAVINEATARKFFGGRSPVGETFELLQGPSEPAKPVQVVGLVRDAKYRSLREETTPIAYLPMTQDGTGPPSLDLELRAAGPARTLIPEVTASIGQFNRDLSLHYSTLSELVSGSLARERLLATLSGFFGALALLLAVVGLYGTMAYAVARRRNEIGIRIALGAARARVIRMVLGEVGRLVIAGVLLGAAVAAIATRWLGPFLFGVAASDPTTWTLSALTLAAAALTAGAFPAWRAAQMDPATSLREE
jgi:putative ABC transport system permease protein